MRKIIFIDDDNDQDDLNQLLEQYADKVKLVIEEGELQIQFQTLWENLAKLKTLDKNIYLDTKKKSMKFNVSEITRFEREKKDTIVILNNQKKLIIHEPLPALFNKLQLYQFCLVHKDHLINLNYMAKFLPGENQVIMIDGTPIPVSRKQKDMLIERLDKWN
jgi:DNA-binding LytR/AlgR family response regulator